jgi:predicted nucleotidyltransferase
MKVNISEEDLGTVRNILARHVPEYEVRVFGSRVQETATESSDLDLVVMTDTPLTTLEMADLREAFSDSSLPFKVDILDWASTKDGFRKIIEGQPTAVVQSTRDCGD